SRSCASSLHLLRSLGPPRVGVNGASVLAEFYIENGLAGLHFACGPGGTDHRAHGLCRQYELAELRVDLRQSSQQYMISATSIDNQELAIRPELASVNDPAVARRRDLRSVASLDHNPLRLGAILG